MELVQRFYGGEKLELWELLFAKLLVLGMHLLSRLAMSDFLERCLRKRRALT